MTATPAEVIVRPNGKPYRRRKPIAASEYETGDGTGLLVQGTLDVERAKGAFVGWLSSLDLLDVEPQRRWLRLVPWDAYGVGCGSSWVEDEVRGTPCVDWMPSW